MGAQSRRSIGRSMKQSSSTRVTLPLLRGAFFCARPILATPALDRLAGLPLLPLTAPAHLPQDAPDMMRILSYAEVFFNHFDHKTQHPRLRRVAVETGPFQQQPGQSIALRRGDSFHCNAPSRGWPATLLALGLVRTAPVDDRAAYEAHLTSNLANPLSFVDRRYRPPATTFQLLGASLRPHANEYRTMWSRCIRITNSIGHKSDL